MRQILRDIFALVWKPQSTSGPEPIRQSSDSVAGLLAVAGGRGPFRSLFYMANVNAHSIDQPLGISQCIPHIEFAFLHNSRKLMFIGGLHARHK